MRLAIDARSLTDEHLTGVGFYTLNLINELAKQAPHDDIMLFVAGRADTLRRLPIFHQTNVETVAITVPNRLLSLLLKLPLGVTLDNFLPRRPDVWLFPNHNIIKTKIPYALTVHDLSFVIYPQFFTLKDRLLHRLAASQRLAEQAKIVFAVSESTQADLISHWGIDEKSVIVTPLGHDETSFVAREQPADKTFRAAYDLNRPYFLSLATKEPRKNLESVIEGYNAYRVRGGRPFPLVLVGGRGWKTNKLERLAEQSPYAEDIRCLGYVPEKHKPAIYRGAKAFLFPAFYEGFGLPVLEAMASGVPVITSASSSLPEIVKEAGILVDPFNVNDITEALLALFDAPDSERLRATLIKKGLDYAKNYAWKSTAQKTLIGLKVAIVR